MSRPTAPAGRNAVRSGSTAVTPGTTLTVHWGRLALALVSLVALLIAVVMGIGALSGAGTGVVALIAALVGVAGVAGLRTLAVRDRRRRVNHRIERAFAQAMDTHAPAAPVPTGPSSVFDGASGSAASRTTSAEATATPATDTQPQETTDRASGGADRTAERSAPSGTAAGGTSPVGGGLPSVPRPTYLDAPEAVRPEPRPLEAPPAPAAAPGTTLKSGVSSEYSAKVEATASRTLDLDRVLARRRAG